MFEINNNVANINGSKGRYDNTVTNPSVRYGRNAVENYYTYLEQPLIADNINPAPILDFGLDESKYDKNADKIDNFLKKNDEYLNALPPLKYEYRYMPNISKGSIDKQAVLGAAYEEMGRKKEIPVEELDAQFAPNTDFSSKPMDVNNDGKIDLAEYGGSILVADMMSKSDIPDVKNIDGTINKSGFDAVLAYTHKSNAENATKLYSNIYNTFALDKAQEEFKPE